MLVKKINAINKDWNKQKMQGVRNSIIRQDLLLDFLIVRGF
jgi:hypothetical protein